MATENVETLYTIHSSNLGDTWQCLTVMYRGSYKTQANLSVERQTRQHINQSMYRKTSKSWSRFVWTFRAFNVQLMLVFLSSMLSRVYHRLVVYGTVHERARLRYVSGVSCFIQFYICILQLSCTHMSRWTCVLCRCRCVGTHLGP